MIADLVVMRMGADWKWAGLGGEQWRNLVADVKSLVVCAHLAARLVFRDEPPGSTAELSLETYRRHFTSYILLYCLLASV